MRTGGTRNLSIIGLVKKRPQFVHRSGVCVERLEERRVLASGAASLMELGPGGSPAPLAMAADARGNYYVAGSFSGTADFNPMRSRTYSVEGGQYSVFLARYSASGGLYWVIAL